MKDVTIISQEEKEIIVKNNAIARSIAYQIMIYFEKNMGKNDMGLSSYNSEKLYSEIKAVYESLGNIADMLKE